MKSVSSAQHRLSQIPSAEIPRSTFDRSHEISTTFDAGLLIPIFVDEALPGDTFSIKMDTLARLATPINPVMTSMKLTSFWFAVPYRLLWNNWEKFNGAQDDPGDSTDFLIPTVNFGTGWIEHSMGDYFGLPTKENNTITTALPFRAYHKIWNEWFRDENLQDRVAVSLLDGPDNAAAYNILRRGKRPDYFTSALPFAQKGDSVTLPLGTVAPVVGTGDLLPQFTINSVDGYNLYHTTSDNLQTRPTGAGAAEELYWDDTKLEADLTNATAATINQLRQAFAIQKLYERDARGGTRYIEVIKAHFNVSSPDMRMQRSEYLGGGSQTINVTPIPQTSSTDATTPQGNLAAYAQSTGSNHGFTHSFTEHCVVIGLVSVQADLGYQQGMDRMWSRQTRWDFYWPALSHIGEQSILNKEIFYDDGAGTNDDVFGYTERFNEYRYKQSKVTGLMRSNATGTLDSWNLVQEFSSLPVLDADFIVDEPPIDRIIAVPAEPHFLFNANINFKNTRPMPAYGTPGLIDRF